MTNRHRGIVLYIIIKIVKTFNGVLLDATIISYNSLIKDFLHKKVRWEFKKHTDKVISFIQSPKAEILIKKWRMQKKNEQLKNGNWKFFRPLMS